MSEDFVLLMEFVLPHALLVCSAVQKVQSYQYKMKISNIMFEFIRLALPMGEKP